ncbi:MAG TPA: 4Fe-4S binding protein [Collinsella ihuae]|uniref:4Fe-4S binding protein n=1 Tax=Collinsella ihumii TaxID=1720204 RepID=A0A921LS73_9ACTN|nr:4Fe-4S binding protein [Collinsella ihumii]
MAEQHDLFDDIIDISKGISALKNPLGGVTDAIMGTGEQEAPQWNPADYKEKPRGNSIPCLLCNYEKSSCRACIDACPVNAIDIEEFSIDIKDMCRKCGLCTSVCPTEAISAKRLQPKRLYDAIAGAAAAYKTAYVTCTRALRRIPRENEVVVACIGDVKPEVWFSIMADYPNVSVYLPLDICTNCKNTTGEEILGDAIATAEEWAGTGLGLEVDSKRLKCEKRREYERKEFMDNIMKTTGLAVSKLNPATAAVTSVAQRLRDHTKKISALEKALKEACGTTTAKRRRVLTQGRQLVLSTLQEHPELAQNIQVSTPECDFSKCTLCGECVRICPTHATDLVGAGRFTVEPTFCVGCGLCAEVCEEHALTMVQHDASDLVVPDPESERRAAEAAKTHAEVEKTKAQAKKTLTKVLDGVEKLAE